MDANEIPDYLETARCSMHCLNPAEQGFIKYIDDQFNNQGTLTEAQMLRLAVIVDEKC